MSMYGTRDAALNWALEYGETLRAAGYNQGKANPCLLHHADLGVSIMVHGDDFVAVGPEKHLSETRKTLEDKYKLKVEMLGRGAGQTSEMRILNRIVRATPKGLELEADPRHAELVVRELDLLGAKPSPVPGAKESNAKTTTTTTTTTPSRSSQTRMALRDEQVGNGDRENVESIVDSVEDA